MSTTFRETLLGDLARMSSDGMIEKFQLDYPFVNAREELLADWANYYSEALLACDPIQGEFRELEVIAIRAFSEFIVAQLDEPQWSLISDRARQLHKILAS